jgi:hypothetical protein
MTLVLYRDVVISVKYKELCDTCNTVLCKRKHMSSVQTVELGCEMPQSLTSDGVN